MNESDWRRLIARAAVTAFVLLLLLILLERIYTPSVTRATVLSPGSSVTQDTPLPYRGMTPPQMAEPMHYDFLVLLEYLPHHSSRIRLIPDDCLVRLELNGRPIDPMLYGLAACDWRHGVELDLKGLIRNGKNLLRVTVEDRGPAAYGLDITPYFITPIGNDFINSGIIFLALGVGWWWLTRRLGFDLWEQLITVAALYLYIVQIHVMPYVYYNFDTAGHLFYLNYMYKNFLPPPTDAEWQAYQPPLYYALTNLLHAFAQFLPGVDITDSGRYVSLGAVMAMLAFVQRAAHHQLGAGRLARMVLLLMAFWPLAAATAARLTNEVLCYALWTGALYFLLRWHARPNGRDFFWSALLTLLAYATKMNGIVMMATLAAVVAAHAWRSGWGRVWQEGIRGARLGLLCLIALLCFASHTGRTLYYNIYAEAGRPLLVGNYNEEGNKNPGDDAQNAAWQFFYFDYQAYVKTTHFSYYEPSTGTQYFWNTFLKTLLFSYSSWNADWLIMLISFLFLPFLFYLGAGIAKRMMTPGSMRWELLPHLVSIAIMISALVGARLYLPKVGMADGRYIYPIIMLLGLLMGHTIQWYHAQKKREVVMLGWGIYGLFAALNVLFLFMQRL